VLGGLAGRFRSVAQYEAERQKVRRFVGRLDLFGFPSTPAVLEAVRRSRWERTSIAILALVGCWALIPIVMFIPPHIEWVLAAFIGGIVLFWRHWRGEYVVKRFEGACPSCQTPLDVKTGSLVRFPRAIPCYSCHHEPWLEVVEGDPTEERSHGAPHQRNTVALSRDTP